MPVISTFYGIIIMMFFDDHNPPHFHVKYGDYEAIIHIVDGEVDGKLPRRVLSMVFEWLDLHKEELMENWRLIEQSKHINKIQPLK
ncbi:MAG: DUF4160 domain-containing protein [Rikenellaceae bacterium]